jgi:hypothetical protein
MPHYRGQVKARSRGAKPKTRLIKMSNEIKRHTNNNGETYYSMEDENGETIYSFTKDFEDTWDQETQDTYGGNLKSAEPSKLVVTRRIKSAIEKFTDQELNVDHIAAAAWLNDKHNVNVVSLPWIQEIWYAELRDAKN